MKFNIFFQLVLISCGIIFFSSCDKDNPDPVNEEELITTVNVICTPEIGGTDIVMTFFDLDGSGGNEPLISGGVFDTNTIYDVRIELLNEAETPAENITQEVREEGDDHQFFFATEVGLNLSFAYNDMDDNGNPIGIDTKFQTGTASSGLLQVTLIHEPDKTATGVREGDISNAKGETDIEVQFPVEIGN